MIIGAVQISCAIIKTVIFLKKNLARDDKVNSVFKITLIFKINLKLSYFWGNFSTCDNRSSLSFRMASLNLGIFAKISTRDYKGSSIFQVNV